MEQVNNTAKTRINPRKGYIDFLGVISTFAVVMLHTNEVFHRFSYEPYWISANVIECLMYFAVPVFLFISAATLLGYRERYTTKEFFFRRMKKTVFPFFFWSLAAMAAQAVYGGGGVKIDDISDISFKLIFDGIFNFRFLSIYSFFGYLFGIYLAIPILSDIRNKLKVFRYMAVVGVLLNSIIPLLCSLADIEWEFISFDICSGYMVYLPLGYLLAKENFSKKSRFFIYMLGGIGLGIHFFGTYFVSLKAGRIDDIFKGYTNLPCILYSSAVFILGRYAYPYIENLFVRLPKLICRTSKYTFGVYLIHIYVVRILMMLTKADIYSLTWRIGSPFIIFPVSIILVWGIRKMPYGRKVCPD